MAAVHLSKAAAAKILEQLMPTETQKCPKRTPMDPSLADRGWYRRRMAAIAARDNGASQESILRVYYQDFLGGK